MSEDFEDIYEEEEREPTSGEDVLLPGDAATAEGKYTKLLGEDSQRFKLSGMFKDWFLDYSSYVILQRAVPHIVDGLKPVQRRVLHAMYKMDDGSYTKVANIVGQAMQYHPHGDASILGALVQLGQKGYTVDCQGNWGNILTGDSNAAPRYIEARLSKFAKEVVFDPDITHYMTSYDGRNQEPTELPVRFPLLLAQGTEGIAVGMNSKILPHNFNELMDASVAILRGEPFEIYPDFPTGGYADCSKYMNGRRGGMVKVRAKIEKVDKNTVVITELPYGKTTHALIDSILKAKDKGKIKIRKIDDLTTEKAELIIHLPNDVSPDKTIDALYAFTDCESTIAPNACVIVEGKPQFLSVNDILVYDTMHTRELLGWQLRNRLGKLEDDWHYLSLEKIFFENRVYKVLEEDQKDWETQLQEVFTRMKEFQSLVQREIVMEDILRLVEKPVRKISKFDIKAAEEKIKSLDKQMTGIKHDIERLTEYTIKWFQNLKKKYGDGFPRRTEIAGFETIAATKVVNNNAKLCADMKEGFVGIGLKKAPGTEYVCDCSDLSEVIVISREGKYMVTKVSDKAFFWKDLIYVGVFIRGDERTVYNVIYRDGKSSVSYAKRFAVTGITRDKEYDLTTGVPGSRLLWFSANHNGEAEVVRVSLRANPKLKKNSLEYDFSRLPIRGRTTRGNQVTKFSISRITLKTKGVSTIGGKDIWYDPDVQRLNEDGRGEWLGQFTAEDKILAVFKDGSYYTTSYDLSNRYQGEVLRIEKFDPDKTFTVLYHDGSVKTFYVKRFSFVPSDNTPQTFIPEGRGSYLVALSGDRYPQFVVTLKGKSADKEPETVDAEAFIAKKGIAAKGKKCDPREIAKVEFIEPLEKEEEAIPGEDNTSETAVPAGTVLSEEEALIDLNVGSDDEQLPDGGTALAPLPAKEPATNSIQDTPDGVVEGDVINLDLDTDDEPGLFDGLL